MEKIITFNPAYDKRDPDPKKDYGVHGVDIKFLLKGKKGATQFILYTGWQLPHVQKEMENQPNWKILSKPLPADLGYHSPVPMYSDQPVMKDCPYLDGKDCYYDGSTLNAIDVFDILLKDGCEGV